jgi:hypothetical protein
VRHDRQCQLSGPKASEQIQRSSGKTVLSLISSITT